MERFSGLVRAWEKATPKSLITYHSGIIFALILTIAFFYYLDIFYAKDHLEWIWYYRAFEYKYHLNGILIFIPLIYTAIIFGWTGIIVAWLMLVAIVMPHVVYFSMDISYLLYNTLILTIPLLLVLVVVLLSKWVQQETKIFAARELERQAYMSQILKAHEDERKNIARELHDESIQDLLAIANRLQSLLDRKSEIMSRNAIEQIELSRDTVFRVSEDLRRLSADLRPSVLDDLGLIEALRSSVDKLNTSSIKATLVVKGEYRKLSPENDVIVFRFIQEALSNIKRHSGASEAIVELDFESETIKIRVHDNGKGLVLPKPISKLSGMHKFGIIDMQERARMLDGIFDINSEHEKGTSILLAFKA